MKKRLLALIIFKTRRRGQGFAKPRAVPLKHLTAAALAFLAAAFWLFPAESARATIRQDKPAEGGGDARGFFHSQKIGYDGAERSGRTVTSAAKKAVSALLNGPDPVSYILFSLQSPIDHLSKGDRKEQRRLTFEAAESVFKELHRPFEELRLLRPGDLAQRPEPLNWNWTEAALKGVQAFLERHEAALGRREINRYLKDFKEGAQKIQEDDLLQLKKFLGEAGIDTADRDALSRALRRLREKNFKGAASALRGKEAPLLSDRETLERILSLFKSRYKSDAISPYLEKARMQALLLAKEAESASTRAEAGRVAKEAETAFNKRQEKILKELRAALTADPRQSRARSAEQASVPQNKALDLPGRQNPWKAAGEFASLVHEGYALQPRLSRSERNAVNLLHKIFEADAVGQKEVALFRDVLKILSLPPAFHHNEFIRAYLDALETESAQTVYRAARMRGEALSDREVRGLLSRIRISFEKQHYDLLKDQARLGRFVQSFPAQFGVFQVGLGAVMFMDIAADQILYGAPKNPVPVETLIQSSLSPSNWAGLAFFIYGASQAGFQVYKFGTKIGSNHIKRLAGPAGLIAGYIFSTMVMDIWADKSLHQCALDLLKNIPSNNFITSCEQASMRWKSRFYEAAPDLAVLFGSVWISEKAFHSLSLQIRKRVWGDRFLVRSAAVLGRFATPIASVLQIAAFLGAQVVLDRALGKDWKAARFVNRLKADAGALQDQIEGAPDIIEHLNAERRRLRSMTEGNEAFLEQENKIQNLKAFLNDAYSLLIERVKKIHFYFNKWNDVKGLNYSQVFAGWTARTNSLQGSVQAAENFLGELYSSAHSLETGSSNQVVEESLAERNQKIIGLTAEWTGQTAQESLINEISFQQECLDKLRLQHYNPSGAPLAGENCPQTARPEVYQIPGETFLDKKNRFYNETVSLLENSYSIVFASDKDPREYVRQVFAAAREKQERDRRFYRRRIIAVNEDVFFLNPEAARSVRAFCEEHPDIVAEHAQRRLILGQESAQFLLCFELLNADGRSEQSLAAAAKKWFDNLAASSEEFMNETADLAGAVLDSSEFSYLSSAGWKIQSGGEQWDPAPDDFIDYNPDRLFAVRLANGAVRLIDPLSPIQKLSLARALLKSADETRSYQQTETEGKWVDQICKSRVNAAYLSPELCPADVDTEEFVKRWVYLSDNPQRAPQTTERGYGFNDVRFFIQERWSAKTKAAAFYLIKEALNDPAAPARNHQSLTALLAPFTVNRKGEAFFAAASASAAPGAPDTGRTHDPGAFRQTLLRAFVCGPETRDKVQNDLIVPPQIFEGARSLCAPNAGDSLLPSSLRLHFLEKPAFFQSRLYETGWLALEELIRESFPSEKALLDHFHKKIAPIKDQARREIIGAFETLTDNFLMPRLAKESRLAGKHNQTLIEEVAQIEGTGPAALAGRSKADLQCAALNAYYSGAPDSGYQGMEIPLFQVNYNLNLLKYLSRLKELEETGEEDPVQRERQDGLQCKVLRHLQRMHDNFAASQRLDGAPGRLIFPDTSFLEELREEAALDNADKAASADSGLIEKPSFIDRLREKYSSDLVHINIEVLFHDVLRKFAPEMNSLSFLMNGISAAAGSYEQQVLHAEREGSAVQKISPAAGFALKWFKDGAEEEEHYENPGGGGDRFCRSAYFALWKRQEEMTEEGVGVFSPVRAPVLDNCRLKLADKRPELVYAAAFSLFNSLERYYRTLGFLTHLQRMKPAFE